MPTNGVIRPPDWNELYRLAILELDSTRLPARIDDARNAILDRLADTLHLRCSYDEHQELSDALNGLRVLRRESECRVQGKPRLAA